MIFFILVARLTLKMMSSPSAAEEGPRVFRVSGEDVACSVNLACFKLYVDGLRQVGLDVCHLRVCNTLCFGHNDQCTDAKDFRGPSAETASLSESEAPADTAAQVISRDSQPTFHQTDMNLPIQFFKVASDQARLHVIPPVP